MNEIPLNKDTSEIPKDTPGVLKDTPEVPKKSLPLDNRHRFGKFSKAGEKYYRWHHEHANATLLMFIATCMIAGIGIVLIIPREAGLSFIIGLALIPSGILASLTILILVAKASGNKRVLMVEQFSNADRALYRDFYDEFG